MAHGAFLGALCQGSADSLVLGGPSPWRNTPRILSLHTTPFSTKTAAPLGHIDSSEILTTHWSSEQATPLHCGGHKIASTSLET